MSGLDIILLQHSWLRKAANAGRAHEGARLSTMNQLELLTS